MSLRVCRFCDMKVVIFFVGNTVNNPVWGRYIGGGLIFTGDSNCENRNSIDAFFSRSGEVFSRREFTDSTIKKYSEEGLEVEFLQLYVDEEEARKIRATCEACAITRKPFNMRDVFLMLLPFRDPEEISLFEAETLNNTQAIILILRECLNKENPLRMGLEGLNSRNTFLDNLYDRFAPYALPVLWCNLIGGVVGGMRE